MKYRGRLIVTTNGNPQEQTLVEVIGSGLGATTVHAGERSIVHFRGTAVIDIFNARKTLHENGRAIYLEFDVPEILEDVIRQDAHLRASWKVFASQLQEQRVEES